MSALTCWNQMEKIVSKFGHAAHKCPLCKTRKGRVKSHKLEVSFAA